MIFLTKFRSTVHSKLHNDLFLYKRWYNTTSIADYDVSNHIASNVVESSQHSKKPTTVLGNHLPRLRLTRFPTDVRIQSGAVSGATANAVRCNNSILPLVLCAVTWSAWSLARA